MCVSVGESERGRERGRDFSGHDFRGRERETLGGLGKINQAGGPSIAARQDREREFQIHR